MRNKQNKQKNVPPTPSYALLNTTWKRRSWPRLATTTTTVHNDNAVMRWIKHLFWKFRLMWRVEIEIDRCMYYNKKECTKYMTKYCSMERCESKLTRIFFFKFFSECVLVACWNEIINIHTYKLCVLCFLPIYSGRQDCWTYQPRSHRRKVTQDFSFIFLLRCLPKFFSWEWFSSLPGYSRNNSHLDIRGTRAYLCASAKMLSY